MMFHYVSHQITNNKKQKTSGAELLFVVCSLFFEATEGSV